MKTRNQRQRKKLHLAEFQELGFLVNWQFAEGTSIETIDETFALNYFNRKAYKYKHFQSMC